MTTKSSVMKTIPLTILFLCVFTIANSQVTETANVTTPGTLNEVARSYLSTVNYLTVTGTIDARDFKTIRDSMPQVYVLDLYSVNIAAYSGTGGTEFYLNKQHTYNANTIPQCAFYQNTRWWSSITFPNNITAIGDSAFYESYMYGSLNIPSSVTNIGAYAFYECWDLYGNLNIPTSVTYIGEGAFEYCSGFSGSLTIPSSVTSIGNNAFSGCSGFKGTLTIPSSVTSIGNWAFYDCTGITGLTIPSSVTNIGTYAFSYCTNLSTITTLNPIPLTTSNMGYYVFNNDLNVSYLFVPCGSTDKYGAASQWNSFNIESNPDFIPVTASADTVIAGKSVTFTANTSCISGSASLQWQVNGKNKGTGTNTFSYIPSNGDQVTCISDINSNNITSNTIVLNVTTISSTQTANVTTPGTLNTVAKAYLNTVTNLTVNGTIDARDFKTMRDSIPNLAVLNISNTTISAYTGTNGTQGTSNISYAANTIPQYAFYNQQLVESKTSLNSLTLPNSITSIGEYAFYSCTGLNGSLNIPSLVNYIGSNAFAVCSGLSGSLNLPSSVNYIGSNAFGNCSGLTGILTLPSTVTYIGSNAFGSCSGFTGTLTIPSSITSVANYAFYACTGFTGLTIPSSVDSIGYWAFTWCTGISGSLTIPSSVTFIGTAAFGGCSGLTGFNVVSGNNYYSSFNGVLFNKNRTKLIQYPGGLTGDYTIPSSVDSIGNNAFWICTGLTGIEINSLVSYIGEAAFSGCSGLTNSLTIPFSVTYIGAEAFYQSGFTGNLTIPYSVTYIGTEAFAFCPGLISITDLNPFPLSGVQFGSNVFYQDNNINYLYVPCGSVSTYEAAPQWNSFDITNNANFVPVSVNADSVKSGTTVTFTANTTCIGGPVVLQWQVNGKNAGTGANTFSYIPVNGDNVNCNATINSDIVTSNTIEMNVSQAELSVSANNLYVSSASNSQTAFIIISNIGWTITSKYDWLTPNITVGSGDTTITLTALANNTGNTRTDTITVYGTGVSSQKIIVTQASDVASQLPTNTLTATAVSSSQINLSWDNDPNATSYHIYWNTSEAWNNGNGWTYLGQFTGTSTNQTGLTGGTTYYYQLYDEGNGATYTKSDAATASATTQGVAATQLPTNKLTATTVSTSQINLSWNYDPNATSYHIYWNTSQAWNNGNGWIYLGQFDGTSTSQTGLTAGTTYYYQLYDEGNGTTYTKSNAATANSTTQSIAVTQLPTNTLTSTAVSTSQIILTWNYDADATSYHIYWNTSQAWNNGSGWTYLGQFNGTSIIQDGLTAGTTYYYQLYDEGNGTTFTTSGAATSSATTLSVPSSSLSLNVSNLSESSSPGTDAISVTSNTSWSAASNADWLTISNGSSGSDNGTINLSFTSNTGLARSAIITVSGSGVTSQICIVTQDAGILTLSVSPSTLNIGDESGSKSTFVISSNTSWNVSSNENWITTDSTSGSDNETITLTASSNPTNQVRSATITVSGSGVLSQLVTVTQYAGPSTLSVSPSTLKIGGESASTANFNINSNTSWEVSSNQTWITPGSTSGSDSATITLTASSNPTNQTRSATITVSASGVTSQTVNVTQDAGPSTLSVSPSTLEIGAGSGSTANFNITSNTSWSVSSNQTWITASSSSGSDNTSITLTASSNPTNQARSATITVSASGVFSQTVTVTQDAGPATLYVSPTTLEISADAGSTETFNITSNTSWEVSSNETWISSSSASGSDNTTITLTASENPTNSTRTATITISASGVFSQTVTVTQDAGPATLSVSPSTLEIGTETGSTATFNITSNTTWNLSSNQNWITLSSASGSGNATITLTATLNSTTETRTADITVSGNGIFSQTVTVTQQSGTGLSELTEADVKLYPNPVIDNLILSLPNMSDQWRFSIYNMLGIEIYSSNVTNSITTIDMSKYPAGVYIIKISLPDQGIITRKFIKQ